MKAYGRGHCCVCGAGRALRRDGTLILHLDGDTDCSGSWKPPVVEAKAEQVARRAPARGRDGDHWTDRARCRDYDAEIFFDNDTSRAKRICQICPVISECRAEAFELDIEHGVWGGMSGKQRRHQKRAVVR